MKASDFTQEQLLELGKLAADMLDGNHDGDTVLSHLTLAGEGYLTPEPTSIDQTFREVHLVTFEPQGEDGGAGGMAWYFTRGAADFQFDTLVGNADYSNDVVAQWSAHVPQEWDRGTTTDYLDDTFVGDVPDGFPIRVHNAPHENWPHQDDQD